MENNNKNTITEQDIFVGATVIRADGLKGKITQVYVQPVNSDTLPNADIKYENGTTDEINEGDHAHGYERFYYIGHTIIGNRVDPETIEEQISALSIERNKLNEQIAQLRKQLYRLNNTMDGKPLNEVLTERDSKEQRKSKIRQRISEVKQEIEQTRLTRLALQKEKDRLYKALDEEDGL